MTVLPNESVLVRTWFGDDNAWKRLVEQVRTPSVEDFVATVMCVDDKAFQDLSPDALTALQPDEPLVSFLADEVTLTHPEFPVLAVYVGADEYDEEEGTDTRPFRVVPGALWSVENNINLGNMGWDEISEAADEDRIYRGMGSGE
ncbi:hypothetical protein ABZ319_24510 [Nocardia sp. NPDC005978]|uniref:DUF6924 domain-containing protein n=1 Tax=Nocardia sp. NPDC005978 TaxID=3156725 RepID=UPI0033B56FFB